MFPIEIWIVFFSFIIFAIAFDLGVSSKSLTHTISVKTAGTLTACWVGLAFLFASLIFLYANLEKTALFITGYLVELALSIDNIFVFILVFNNFKISQKAQHKVLIIGILSTIIMRFLMISAGVYLIQKFQWVFYIFGTFLIYSGIKIIKGKEERKEEQSNGFISFVIKKLLPISEEEHGDKFTVKIKGKRYFTSLFVVLLIIEKIDLIFALDSIPAILAITDDIFIVLTSNIFAILGLRSMYFFLSDILERFIYIKHALSIILCFIGCKMIASVQGYHVPILLSLFVIIISILT
ncbi:MAG: TerC/Alx family metal homeostasis membrane protein, partial [Candidatus Midichloria sp.]|nr:TerC/Alx family metal homeostasis membrane protein [Candidatus Midichloria sp.]